ncbi:hypothetical protein QJQ45_018896 [Haematococcus lacustris]|nr:hypothetical protein QJQ45_018896 [Haematococcus lacustris]
MKGGQHLKASHPPSAQEQPRPAKKRAGRVGQRVAGWGQRAPGAAELDMPDLLAFDDQPQPQQKHGSSWVKWAIRKERSDAAARQNETQRQFDYVASAPAHEKLLTSKRAALQAAMQEQLDSAWEQHAAQHAASSAGPSPLQQVERLFLNALCATQNPLNVHPPKPNKVDSFREAFNDYRRTTHRAVTLPSLLKRTHAHKLPTGAFADCPVCAILPSAPDDGYTRSVSTDACLQPSSYAGTATATCNIEQHLDTYFDRSGLEGYLQELHQEGNLNLKGAFSVADIAAAQAGGDTGGADAFPDDGGSGMDCCAPLSCARPHTSSVSAGQRCDIRGVVGFVCCHGIPLLGYFCNLRTPEQFVYYLMALAGLVHQCEGKALHVYIDFACQFKITWARFAKAIGLSTTGVHLMVNWMHGASHNLSCQLRNNGRYLLGAAWRVGEQTEQLWSMFKAISSMLRYMSLAHRADAIQCHLSSIASDKEANILDALQHLDKAMRGKQAELEEKKLKLESRAVAEGVTDVACACKTFVDSSLDVEATSVRTADWWMAVWLERHLEWKALEALSSSLSLGGKQPTPLPSIALQPDLAQLLTRRAGRATHEQRKQTIKDQCLSLDRKHNVHAQECFKTHDDSAIITTGLQLLKGDKLARYRSTVLQLSLDARELGLRQDELGRKGQETRALSKGIKAKLKQARVQLDEMAEWQVLGTSQLPNDVRVTDEQLQSIVHGEPAPWDEESTSTPRGKLLHYGRLFHQLLSDSDRCQEQLALLHVEQGRLQAWLEHMLKVCQEACAERTAEPGTCFYVRQHHKHYSAMLAKLKGLQLGRPPAPA